MTLANPAYLQLGVGIALLVVLAHWSHTRRRRRLAEFLGGRRGAQRVSRTNLYRAPVERVVLLVLATLALGAAAAEPIWDLPVVEPPPPPRVRNIVFVMDVSASMQANDALPTRLGEAVRVARELLPTLERDRVGLLLFAGRAYPLAPPTHDHDALRYLLDGVTPTIASAHDPGSLPSAAIAAAAALLERQTDEGGGRVIVLIGDGEAGEPESATAAAVRAAADQEIVVHTVGIGTPGGSGMVMPAAPYQLGGRIVNEAGAPVVSRLREPRLRAVAQLGGGVYAHAADARSLDELSARLETPIVGAPPVQAPPLWTGYDPTVWLTLLALVLLLLESLFDLRLPGRAWALVRRPA